MRTSLFPNALHTSAAIVFAQLLTAQTIVVSGGGAALQQAIDTAPPGAHLLVQPGAYSAITVRRGMRVQLLAGTSILNVGGPAVSVVSVPPGETFVLEGVGNTVQEARVQSCVGDVVFANVDFLYDSSSTNGLQVVSCSGAVTFQDIGPTIGAPWGGSMPILDSAQVSFHRAVMRRPLHVTNSRVAMTDVTTPAALSMLGGLRVDSGSVFVAGGSLAAAAQFSLLTPLPAVTVAGGQLTVTGGAVLTAAPAVFSPATAPAISMLGGSLRLDPSVVLNPVPGAPPIAGPGQVQTLRIPSLGLAHAGTTMTGNVFAGAGDAVFTLAGLSMTPAPTPWGDAWLSPADPILDVTVLPASGTHSFAKTFANVPPFVVLTVQSVALSPSGALVVGAPVRLVWD